MTTQERFPQEREILPAFALPDEEGRLLDLERFRQERNLVVCFVREIVPPVASLLRGLAERRETIDSEDAKVIVIVSGTQEQGALLKERLRLPFPVLSDEVGMTVDRFCRTAAVYVTDRFREIFATGHDGSLLSGEEIVEWLAHINRQCPE